MKRRINRVINWLFSSGKPQETFISFWWENTIETMCLEADPNTEP